MHLTWLILSRDDVNGYVTEYAASADDVTTDDLIVSYKQIACRREQN